MLKARGAGSTYHRNGLDQPPVYTCGNGAAIPATRPSSSTCTSRYGPPSAGHEYPETGGGGEEHKTSPPPPASLGYTSAAHPFVVRGAAAGPVTSAPSGGGAGN